MVMLFNETGTIGIILKAATMNITGSEFLTYLGIILLVITFFLIFRIPIEATAVLIMPLLLVLMAFSGNLLAIGGAFLIYLGILLAKNFII